MTLILSGTDGLSDVDGTAATPAIRGTDANTGMFFPAADTIAFSEGGVEAMRLDSAGNMGLGVTPSAWGAGIGAMQFRQGGISVWALSGSNGYVYANAYYDGATNRYVNNGTACSYAINNSNGQHAWFTAPSGTAGNAISFTQAMSLTAAGNLLIGTTSAAYAANERFSLINSSGNNGMGIAIGNTNNVGLGIYNGYTQTGSATAIQFADHNSIVRGSIQVTTSATSYNTSSDYRLKESVQPMVGALAKVAQLKPCTYKWKADGSDGEGFIAHELAEVVPQCVTGAKDAVDADGKPVYQGIDTSFLVATLTAAMQELKAMNDTLTARITQLEAK